MGTEAETRVCRRLCRLQYAAGRIEDCPGAGCPFWEEGGAALPGGCVLERLGLDLEGRPELVEALIKIRSRLGTASTREDEQELHSLFYRLARLRDD
jgi:hypothetical protein